MSDRAMRPFWLHQLVEYMIGLILVATGLQGPEPLVPAVVGGVVLLNAAGDDRAARSVSTRRTPGAPGGRPGRDRDSSSSPPFSRGSTSTSARGRS